MQSHDGGGTIYGRKSSITAEGLARRPPGQIPPPVPSFPRISLYLTVESAQYGRTWISEIYCRRSKADLSITLITSAVYGDRAALRAPRLHYRRRTRTSVFAHRRGLTINNILAITTHKVTGLLVRDMCTRARICIYKLLRNIQEYYA